MRRSFENPPMACGPLANGFYIADDEQKTPPVSDEREVQRARRAMLENEQRRLDARDDRR